MKRPIVYFDMDDVLCAFSKAHRDHLRMTPEIFYPQCKMDFFRKLEPIQEAVNLFFALQEHFDVYILTAPSEYNPLSYTEKRIWVEEHLGMDAVKKLIISPNKALSIGDYLIDDKASGKGQDGFTGRLIQIGSKEFPNWESIASFFSAVQYCECCPVDAQ